MERTSSSVSAGRRNPDRQIESGFVLSENASIELPRERWPGFWRGMLYTLRYICGIAASANDSVGHPAITRRCGQLD